MHTIAMTVSLRLPDALAQALAQLSKATDRPKSYLLRKALETYLAEHADYQIALDRLRDKDDAIIDGTALRKRLGA